MICHRMNCTCKSNLALVHVAMNLQRGNKVVSLARMQKSAFRRILFFRLIASHFYILPIKRKPFRLLAFLGFGSKIFNRTENCIKKCRLRFSKLIENNCVYRLICVKPVQRKCVHVEITTSINLLMNLINVLYGVCDYKHKFWNYTARLHDIPRISWFMMTWHSALLPE